MPELISLLGKNELIAAIDGWQADTKELRTPFTEIGQTVLAPFFEKRFAASGPGWAALSPAYAAIKQASHPGQPILVASGKMRKAFTAPSAFKVTENSITMDAFQNVPYARYHQTGTKHMPKRQIIPSDLAQLAPVVGARLGTYLLDKGKARGFRTTE